MHFVKVGKAKATNFSLRMRTECEALEALGFSEGFENLSKSKSTRSVSVSKDLAWRLSTQNESENWINTIRCESKYELQVEKEVRKSMIAIRISSDHDVIENQNRYVTKAEALNFVRNKHREKYNYDINETAAGIILRQLGGTTELLAMTINSVAEFFRCLSSGETGKLGLQLHDVKIAVQKLNSEDYEI